MYGFMEEFSQLLSEVSIDYYCIVISGDLNIHINVETDPVATNFINLASLEAFDFSQHVHGSTH